MERFPVSHSLNFAQDVVAIGNFNICGEARHPLNIPNLHPPNQETSNSKPTKTLYQDLSEMPELGDFYSRTPELHTLTGISGIGKTTLAVQLVQQIKDECEYAVWYTLDQFPTLEKFQSNVIQLFSRSEKQDSSHQPKCLPLIKYLQNPRCLIVLDDVHNLFYSGEFA